MLPRFATRRGSTFVELLSGTREEILDKWKAGVACADVMDKKGLAYVATALNSNSVAGTFAKCMDLNQPFVAPNDFSRPGSQRQLLTNDEINTIRSQLNLPPINGGTNREPPPNDTPTKRGALDQNQSTEMVDGKSGDRLRGDTAASGDRRLILSDFGTG